MLLLTAVLGVVAGVLTTLCGMGGGLLLVSALSLVWGPGPALAATAPALLLGNLHRAVLYRRHVDRRIAAALVAGVLPGSVAGGLLVVRVPPELLHGLMFAMAALALLHAVAHVSWRPPAGALLPAGFGIGAVAATAGGAGVLSAPLLLASGLAGRAYVATGAVSAVAMHVGRLSAYGAGGLLDAAAVSTAAALAPGIVAGNVLADRLRPHLPEAAGRALEHGAVLLAALLCLGALVR